LVAVVGGGRDNVLSGGENNSFLQKLRKLVLSCFSNCSVK
jgi:hypothetical protein